MSKKKQQERQQAQRQEVTQLLRQAGNNGNLGQREFQQILDAGGNANRVLERAVANRGLTIASGVVNSYNKGKYTTPASQFMQMVTDRTFGPGFGLSPIIQQIRTAGKLDPKSALFIGSKGSTATVLPKSMMAGTSSTKSPVTAPANPVEPTTNYSPEPMDAGSGGGFDTGFTDSGSSGVPDNSSIPDPKFSPGGSGFGTDSGLTSFRRKRSSRALAGLTTKGPGQLKISGQSSKSSGLNIGA